MHVALIAIGLAVGTGQDARPSVASARFELTPATREQVIAATLAALEQRYVFPRVAEEMEAAIRGRMQAKEYDALIDPQRFAETLTAHLREVSSDKHLRVRFSAEPLPEEVERSQPTADEVEEMRREAAWENFGFERVARLPGNVGYLDLRRFMPPQIAADTAHAAMAFLANTDALIVDLRENGGGTPEMVQLLCSYLFGGAPVHLNDIYMRPEDRTEEFWTLVDLPGLRYLDQEVFVLTSSYTFSGAEEFAYDLKCLKRASIVGEVTGGGAHPGGPVRVHEHFVVNVPMGRAINPITKTNWEGVGVEPDVAVAAEAALDQAHALALEHLIPHAAPDERRERLELLLGGLKQKLAERAAKH